jgi:ATP-dependent helicase HrpA
LFNIEVVNNQGETVGQGRNLLALRDQLCVTESSDGALPIAHRVEKQGSLEWDFGALSEFVESVHGGIKVRRYPALIDKKTSVNIALCDSQQEAYRLSVKGIMRLLVLRQAQGIRQLRKDLAKNKFLIMHYRSLGNERDLLDALIDAAVIRAFKLEHVRIYTQADFDSVYDAGCDTLFIEANELAQQAERIFSLHQKIEKKLKGSIPLAWADSLADIKQQLSCLIFEGFLSEVPDVHLKDYPRYLQAILKRIEKLQGNTQRDRVATQEFKVAWEQYAKRADKHQREGLIDPSLAAYRWMLEEYRVSLFAQELKTKVPVSPKRLRALWEQVAV